MGKLLVEINDFTPLRGGELIQEIYMIVLGLNTQQHESSSAPDSPDLRIIEDPKLLGWYYLQVTPIIQCKRGQKHTFPGGLPIFYNDPGDLASIYLAFMESDAKLRKSKDLIAVLKESVQGISDILAPLLTTPTFAVAKQLLPLLLKVIETALIKNNDDLRYTNVLTFRKGENFLTGTHADFGNQRIDFTLTVEQNQ